MKDHYNKILVLPFTLGVGKCPLGGRNGIDNGDTLETLAFEDDGYPGTNQNKCDLDIHTCAATRIPPILIKTETTDSDRGGTLETRAFEDDGYHGTNHKQTRR